MKSPMELIRVDLESWYRKLKGVEGYLRCNQYIIFENLSKNLTRARGISQVSSYIKHDLRIKTIIINKKNKHRQ